MKFRILFLGLFAGLVSVGIGAFLSPSDAQQQDLPFDSNAVLRTHVPHFNSHVHGGEGGGPGTVEPPTPAVFGGFSYTVGSTETPTTTGPEAEEHIAVDPNNSSNLVAAISDFFLRGGFNTTKYVVSADNGNNWTESYVPLNSQQKPVTGDGKVWDANSDPVVAIDRLGNVYLANLYLKANVSGVVTANGVYVSVDNIADGVNFTSANTFRVAFSPNGSTSHDKEWIAVDNSTSTFSGNVYVSWTRFTSTSVILFSRSTNHGATWSTPIQINPSSQNGAVQGSQVAVGPDGAVYVAYQVYFSGGMRRHYLAKSTNGGASFTAPVAITPLFSEVNFSSSYRKNSFPNLAVSPVSGSDFVYNVYAAQTSNGADVQFVRSTTAGGTSFTSPVTINDVLSGQQFEPAVTVDGSGVIHTAWYDTRNSTSGSRFMDVYATYSTDGGGAFAPNTRVTAFLIDAGNASFIGDYKGIAAAGGFAHPAWTDGGFNGGQLQTATLTLP